LHLELELDGPSTFSWERGSTTNIVTKVIYLGISGSTEQRPITFHTYELQEEGVQDGFRLHRLRNGQWEGIDPVSYCAAGIADSPDIEVNVSEHKHFVSLQPGGCWTASHTFYGDSWDIPSGLADGDVFRYRYKGGEVDWWDWGDSEDHIDTFVKLPPWAWSQVIEPEDNGGRPKLIVPMSNEILLTNRD
jgi:hypothetical protein